MWCSEMGIKIMEFEHLGKRISFLDEMQHIAIEPMHCKHDLIDGQLVWADWLMDKCWWSLVKVRQLCQSYAIASVPSLVHFHVSCSIPSKPFRAFRDSPIRWSIEIPAETNILHFNYLMVEKSVGYSISNLWRLCIALLTRPSVNWPYSIQLLINWMP